MRSILSCFAVSCLSFAVLNAGAQAAAPGSTPAASQSKTGAKADPFAAEPFVVRQWDAVYSYNPDGTGFRTQTFTVAIQSDASLRAFSVLAIPFAGASEQVHFTYARVRHPDGTVVETPLDSAMEEPEPVTRQAPLYSDLKQQELPVKNLRVGDTLEWQVRVDRTKAEAPGEFWGRQDWATGAVALSETIELRVPANHPVKLWTNPESMLDPVPSTEGNQRVYRWKNSALKPTVGPEAEAARKAKEKAVLTPAEQADATFGKLPDVAWTSFQSWDAIAAWYRSLETGRTEPNPAITAKVNEITAGKTTLDDKVRAVYAYVSGQVHYIGVDLGVGRYQPHTAAEVMDNQYGDCKDKHTLLAAMLQVLGVHADAVLIGAGIRFNKDLPAPDNFNHLITHLVLNNEEVWLDATEEVAPYRMMFAPLRDKEALIVAGTTARIARTPADPPFPTFEKMTAVGTIDKDGNADSHFTLTERGDEELFVRAVLTQVTAAQYDELTQKIVANLGFGGTVTHAQFLHVADNTQPLVMEWDYHREKPGNDWDNLRTVLPLLMTLLPAVDEKNPPTGTIQLPGARDVTSTAQVTLPASWSAELPEAVHTRSAYGTYDLTFRYDKGVVYAERHWTVAKKEVPQSDWELYKKWTDEMALGNEPYVQLRSGSPSKLPTVASLTIATREVGDGAKHIAEANQAIRNDRLDEAAALLEKAKGLDAKPERNVAAASALLALRRGNHPEAIRLYRKEIDDFPDNGPAYTALSQLQNATGDSDGAVDTLRRYVAARPENADAATILIATLNQKERDADAVAAADAALSRLPGDQQTNTRFQFAVLQAELRGGHKQRGAGIAESLLASTTDLRLINDTAYELAVAGENLPLAEKAERDVLEKLTAESEAWTLDEDLSLLRSKSELLTAAWDTMGWILFQEGHRLEALPWLRARWLYHPSAEVGRHLGDAEAAQGHPDQARHVYQLALATVSPYTPMGMHRTESTREEDELHLRLSKSDTPSDNGRSGAHELQALRTISLPSALGHDGTVQYKVLLSPRGVVRAEAMGKKDLSGGDELLQRAVLPAGMFPPGSSAQLVRLGTLNCHQGTCELVFVP